LKISQTFKLHVNTFSIKHSIIKSSNCPL